MVARTGEDPGAIRLADDHPDRSATSEAVVSVANLAGKDDDSVKLNSKLNVNRIQFAIQSEPDSVTKTDYSVSPTDYSVSAPKETETDYSVASVACQPAQAQVTDLAAFRAQLNSQLAAVYDRRIWKRSRIKKGYLIRRHKGYDLIETEYGISYVYVLSRKPYESSADYSVYPLAGFFNWPALETAGLLAKERRNGKRQSRS